MIAQFAIGPSVQLHVKPLIKLKNVTTFHLDDTRSRFLVLETGYRYITALGAALENRMLTAVTFNLPVGTGIRLSDRNRAALVLSAGPWAVTFDNYPLLRLMPTLPCPLVYGRPQSATSVRFVVQKEVWASEGSHLTTRKIKDLSTERGPLFPPIGGLKRCSRLGKAGTHELS